MWRRGHKIRVTEFTRGEQNRKNPHIAHKSAKPQRNPSIHISNDLRTFFFTESRYQIPFPNICEFRGPKTRGSCTGGGRMRRFGSAPPSSLRFFFGWPNFFPIVMGKRSKAPPLHCSRARTRAIWPTRIATAVERYLFASSTGDFSRFHKSAPPQNPSIQFGGRAGYVSGPAFLLPPCRAW